MYALIKSESCSYPINKSIQYYKEQYKTEPCKGPEIVFDDHMSQISKSF